MDSIWQYVLRTETFLDCKIFHESGMVLTNKFFLSYNKQIWNIVKSFDCLETCDLIMPEHSEEEIKKELNGFIKLPKVTDFLEETSLVCTHNEVNRSFTTEKEFSIELLNDCQEKKSRSQKKKKTPKIIDNSHSFQEKGEHIKMQCEICGKSFSHSKQLRMHKYQVHVEGKNLHECLLCKMNFKTKSILREGFQKKV